MATIFYRVGGGAEQSIAATYGQSVEIPGSAGQDVTFRVETDEQTAVYVAPPVSGGGVIDAVALSRVFAREVVNTSSAVGDGIGPDGNGWVVEVRLPGVGDSGGSFNPDRLALEVSDPGFDTSGSPVTRSRRIRGQAILRHQWPNDDQLMVRVEGGDLIATVALDDFIYAGTSVISAAVETDFYSIGGISGAVEVTNDSTLPYPNPIFGWITPDFEMSSGATLTVECAVYHRHGMQGQQVACVELSATDGVTTTPSVLVGAPMISSRITQGDPLETWQGDIDVSQLSQGATCTAIAVVYPFMGSPLDLSVSGHPLAAKTPMRPLQFVCDKTNGYSGAVAFVSVGATGGVVSDDSDTARSAPFGTVQDAISAIRVWHNVHRSRDDFGGGTVYLMDDSGGDQVHTLSGSVTGYNVQSETWITVTPDPLASGVVTLTSNGGANRTPPYLKLKGVRVETGGNYLLVGPNDSSAPNAVCVEGCIVSSVFSEKLATWYGVAYSINVTVEDGVASLIDLPGEMSFNALTAGTILAEGTHVRLRTPSIIVSSLSWHEMRISELGRGFIMANCTFGGCLVNSNGNNVDHGCALVQNLVINQNTSPVGAAIGNGTMSYFADGDQTTCDNVVEVHNTCLGDRTSRCYNDDVGTRISPYGTSKYTRSMYSIWDNYNLKAENFNVSSAAEIKGTGNWAAHYNVGQRGCVSLFGSVQRSETQEPHPGNYLGPSWHSSSEYNLQRPALGHGESGVFDMFADYGTQPRENARTDGDYHLTPSAGPLRGRVPAGEAILAFDKDGSPRANDGTGAAGCYEG